jgi:hypothetical protein
LEGRGASEVGDIIDELYCRQAVEIPGIRREDWIEVLTI